jgi:glycosyltransferase involved in cell wall biosynthesis
MHTVVYDHQIFSHQEFGGVSRYFCELAGRVQGSSAWRARVIAPLHYNRYLAESDVPTVGIYAPLAFAKLAKVYALFNDLICPPLLKLTGSDLLHQTYYGAKAETGRGPFVITVYDMIHELLPQYFSAEDPIPRLKRKLIETADHIICISRRTADDLIAILGVPPAKISVTHLAFSEIFAAPPAAGGGPMSHDGRPYLLYVGKRDGYKNFSRVFDAYSSSAHLCGKFDLIAFGGGAFTSQELARFAGSGRRPNSIRHLSGDDAALARLYAGARAFVYPSEYEGFGIPPLEAMACGCAVVCSNTSSIPEVVGQAGEYFDPTNVESMRAALEKVAFDEARHDELVSAGRLRSRLFSWDRCAAETMAVYEKVIDGYSSK